MDLAALPADVAALQRMIGELMVARGSARAEAQAEIERLRGILVSLQRNRFGRRSEQMDDDQLRLGLEDLDADIARAETALPATPPLRSSARGEPDERPSLPDHLPRDEMVLDVDIDCCPGCGGAVHAIGETVSEMLDYVPASFRVLRIRRPRYGCRACDSIHQEPAPERPIAKGLATPGLLAHVLVSKYADHVPLYRQSQILARQGIGLNRSTLANWVGGAAWWLESLRDRLAEHVFASTKIFADDTPVPVLDPGRGRTRTGRLWVYSRDDRPWNGKEPPAAVYFYSPDRKGERPAVHLSAFKGVLQVDGYAGFERLASKGDVVLAACWAHARRKVYDGRSGDRRAGRSRGPASQWRTLCMGEGDPRAEPGRAERGPELWITSSGRRPQNLAGDATHEGAASQWPCRSHPICPRSLGGAQPVP